MRILQIENRITESSLITNTRPALQRVFFRMKRNFEKKQKSIARAYSKEKGRGEELLYNSIHVTFASHTFDNEGKDFK